MYHYLKIDLTKEIDAFSFTDLVSLDLDVYECSDDPLRFHSDIVFSNNKEFLKEYKRTYSLEPKIKTNHSKILNKICKKIDYNLEELILQLLNKNVIADIAVFNRLSYKELLQLLIATMSYEAQNNFAKTELIVLFENDAWDDYRNYSISFIIEQYTNNLHVLNMLSVPKFGAFAQKIKGYKS